MESFVDRHPFITVIVFILVFYLIYLVYVGTLVKSLFDGFTPGSQSVYVEPSRVWGSNNWGH